MPTPTNTSTGKEDGKSRPEKRMRETDSLGTKKKAPRYSPGVPMTKEELAAWRKEKRRIRNRESAAKSRLRTQQKIQNLEEQLESLVQKHAKALQRIAELEAMTTSTGTPSPILSSNVVSSHFDSKCQHINMIPRLPALVAII
mmetsp:Transcript_16482/g.24927  ORF Transcript_16482/g.24927 Transcript_16482/m.24927 type:complete len:143 (+) Transcript_16482:66-494(+)|eukprot:CAMPEP_0178921248 /NCGR_PEP_ID=MMETSP0786-20121207/15457_1 /TAXON_ID=186022 /ORGANISM="Thalassionema frauenfeldii, Strain CCMP 1798" /LENGTH=142 /DNA_ID=CAMNT_0020595409 /DNA_START=52 /DNA_END=480 /DNA_ORIENTATION=-